MIAIWHGSSGTLLNKPDPSIHSKVSAPTVLDLEAFVCASPVPTRRVRVVLSEDGAGNYEHAHLSVSQQAVLWLRGQQREPLERSRWFPPLHHGRTTYHNDWRPLHECWSADSVACAMTPCHCRHRVRLRVYRPLSQSCTAGARVICTLSCEVVAVWNGKTGELMHELHGKVLFGGEISSVGMCAARLPRRDDGVNLNVCLRKRRFLGL